MADKTTLLLILASAVTNALASTVMKHAYGGDGSILSGGLLHAALRIALDPWTMAGIALFGVSFFFMAGALSRAELTFAYPMMSAVVYLLLSVIGFAVFHEKITPSRIAAMLLILAGIYILSRN